MRTVFDVQKMKRDVLVVLEHMHCIVWVDEQGVPYYSETRGEPVRKGERSARVNSIAVLGPHKETGHTCVWLEIGVHRAVPYARVELQDTYGRRRKIVARARFYHPTDAEMRMLWPYLLYEMETHMHAVLGEWRSGCVWHPRVVREFLSRRNTAFLRYSTAPLPKGVRFRVSMHDNWLVKAVVASDWAKNSASHAGRYNFLSLCLGEENGAQSKEGWNLVRNEERIILARDVLDDTASYVLAGSLVPSELHVKSARSAPKSTQRISVPYEWRLETILSLLQVVNREKYDAVLWWMAQCARIDMMPGIPHVYLRPPTSWRRDTFVFELAPVSREEVRDVCSV